MEHHKKREATVSYFCSCACQTGRRAGKACEDPQPRVAGVYKCEFGERGCLLHIGLLHHLRTHTAWAAALVLQHRHPQQGGARDGGKDGLPSKTEMQI